jgi:hypothetical protein
MDGGNIQVRRWRRSRLDRDQGSAGRRVGRRVGVGGHWLHGSPALRLLGSLARRQSARGDDIGRLQSSGFEGRREQDCGRGRFRGAPAAAFASLRLPCGARSFGLRQNSHRSLRSLCSNSCRKSDCRSLAALAGRNSCAPRRRTGAPKASPPAALPTPRCFRRTRLEGIETGRRAGAAGCLQGSRLPSLQRVRSFNDERRVHAGRHVAIIEVAAGRQRG